MASLVLTLLGGCEARLAHGAPLSLASKKAMALLAFLAISERRPVSREKLASLLWGDVSGDAHARRSLRQALSVLRKALPSDILCATREHVWLELAHVEVDAVSFMHLAGEGSRASLQGAAALYQGELLEGFSARADAFDDWLVPQKQCFRDVAIEALHRLLGLQRAEGDIEAATGTALRLVSLDPCDEEAHGALMHLFAMQGRTSDALRQFRQCCEVLERELCASPGPGIERLHDDIRRGHIQPPAGQPEPPGRELPAPASPAPELRIAAVLFASLSGTSPDGHDAGLVAEYQAVARAAVESHGGRVCKDLGDTVMAVFGVPSARGNDLERAVHAAVAVQEQLRAHDLAASIAVTIGQAMVTGSGAACAIMGEPVSQAARLHLHAEAGEVLLSHAAGLGLSTRAALSRVELASRASAPPVLAWRVERLQAEPRFATPFVGRAYELAQLEAALDILMHTGRGRTFLIVGEAGLGKTRLIERLGRHARDRGIAVHRASVLDFGTRRGRDAIASLLRSLLGAPVDDTAHAATARPAVDVAMAAAAGASPERALVGCAIERGLLAEAHRRGLEALLDVHPPGGDEAQDRDGREARERGCREALCALIAAASRAAPRLLVMDDIHWADARVHDHIADMAGQVASCPALLVMTSRPVDGRGDGGWQRRLRGQPLTTLTLAPLVPEEALALAEGFRRVAASVVHRDGPAHGAGGMIEAVSAEHLQVVVARAGGNPLFIEQLLLVARSEQDVPDSVQSIFQARLDALPAGDRATLQAASVLGQRLARDLLAQLVERPDVDLGRLEAEGLLRCDGTELIFAHGLLREAVHASLLPERRQALHRRAAALLAHEEPVLHAQHLDLAGAAEAAPAYLVAARAEEEAGRSARALALCERGLALAAEARTRFELSCLRAALLRWLGDVDASAQGFRAALPLAPDDTARSRAWVGIAEAMRVLGSREEALAALARAEALADEEREPRALAQISYLRGSVLFPHGDAEGCLAAHERALAYARRAGCVLSEVRASSGIGDAHYMVGRMESARTWFERCLLLCREHGLHRLALPNLTMRGHSRMFQLEVRAAAEDCLTAATTAAQTGELSAELVARSAACLPLLARGEIAAAEAQARGALELGRRTGLRRFDSTTLCYVAAIHAARGEQDEAEACLARAYQLCQGDSLSFSGGLVLGMTAALTRQPELRRRALHEGDALLARGGGMRYGELLFLQNAIDTALAERAPERAERYAAMLEPPAQAERIPWAALYRARALALARFHRGARSAELCAELVRLVAWARRVELLAAIPAMERAIAVFDARGSGRVA